MSTDLLSVASEALSPAKYAGYIVNETGEGQVGNFGIIQILWRFVKTECLPVYH